MKKIEVSDEMYNELIKLATEMTTQDNRCTSMPHMFQIRTKEEVAAYEGCDGEEIWVNGDGDELRTDEGIKEYIVQDIYDNDESLEEISDDDELLKKISKKIFTKMDEEEIIGFLEDKEYRKVEVTTIDRYQNTFFTAKACDEHIKSNHYHYNEPVCYLNHAYRNPEMELVSEFLCSLVGKKQHK